VTDLDIRGLLQELVRDEVDFLIIGGVAVGYHGYVRATKDVDVVPSPDPTNLERLARVLGRLEATIEGAEECGTRNLRPGAAQRPAASASRSTWAGSLELGKKMNSSQPALSKAARYPLTVSASLAAEPAMRLAVSSPSQA